MKPLVIYHKSCSDGFAAAYAAWLKFGDAAEYLPQQYGTDYSKSENVFEFRDREVYILDFSFPRDIMDMLFDGAARVVWLDHHKTAFEMWCGKPSDIFFTVHKEQDARRHLVLDDCKSGAMLAWEYFHPNTEVPALIRHIDDRDRWQFKLDGSKELHAALWSYQPWTFDQWENILDLRDQIAVDQMISEGAAILRAQEAAVKNMLKHARCCQIIYSDEITHDLRGLALNTNMHISEAGHELANQTGSFGLIWYIGDNGKAKCSLRSNGEYDVSCLARHFGGGGHRNAAGFSIEMGTLLEWLK